MKHARVLLAALVAMPLAAQPADPLQVADATVQTVGFRLGTGNSLYCANLRPAVGLLLQDAGNYDDPELAREVLGLKHDIAIEAVAAGSPAAAAGLVANMGVLSLAGHDLTALPEIKAGEWKRLDLLTNTVETTLFSTGELALTVERGGAVEALTLHGIPSCSARFELATSGRAAEASGERVIITRRMFDELGGEEELVAAVMAHELAHVVLGHRFLKKMPVSAQEDEADRLSVWLLHNAGYDPASAVRVQREWGKAQSGGLFIDLNHGSWKKRARRTETEIEIMRAAIGTDGKADWGFSFPRWRRE